MVKIRLVRLGKRNDPFYRVVAIDSEKKNIGEALDVLGYWNPREKVSKIDKKAIKEWQEKGAQISPAVTKLLV